MGLISRVRSPRVRLPAYGEHAVSLPENPMGENRGGGLVHIPRCGALLTTPPQLRRHVQTSCMRSFVNRGNTLARYARHATDLPGCRSWTLGCETPLARRHPLHSDPDSGPSAPPAASGARRRTASASPPCWTAQVGCARQDRMATKFPRLKRVNLRMISLLRTSSLPLTQPLMVRR